MSSLPASGNTSTTNDVDQITNDVAQIKLETKNENKNVLKSSSPSPRLHTKFTKEEMEIFSKVSKQLLKSKQNGGSGLSSNQVLAREVAMITLISKCRVDTAVKKYEHFIDTLKE